MQIPLIIKTPGLLDAGRRTDAIVNQYDILPTLLDVAALGEKTVAGSPGISFTPILRNQQQQRPGMAFFEYITARAVVTEEWKFIKRMFGEPSELYNLKADPQENVNLIDDPELAEVATQLSEEIDRFFRQYANPAYDPWRGGTGKAILMYSDRNERFEAAFPDWRKPFVEKLEPFSDR